MSKYLRPGDEFYMPGTTPQNGVFKIIKAGTSHQDKANHFHQLRNDQPGFFCQYELDDPDQKRFVRASFFDTSNGRCQLTPETMNRVKVRKAMGLT